MPSLPSHATSRDYEDVMTGKLLREIGQDLVIGSAE